MLQSVELRDGALRFRGRDVERMPLSPGYEALLISTALSFSNGDVIHVDDDRLLIVQSSRTRIEREGSASVGSRTVLVTRPVAALSVLR